MMSSGKKKPFTTEDKKRLARVEFEKHGKIRKNSIAAKAQSLVDSSKSKAKKAN